MVNFKTHAKRISQGTSAKVKVIQKILENKEYIRLGFDIKRQCFIITFYFGSDDEYYILSIDEKNTRCNNYIIRSKF